MTTIELLEKLTSPSGVAGEENSSFEALKGLFSLYGDVSTDVSGNIIIHKNGKGKHILLDAHLDTIGFVVTGITDDGFIRVQKVGGVDMRTVEGLELLFTETKMFTVLFVLCHHTSLTEKARFQLTELVLWILV